jgi:hypothetical protein
MERTNPTSKMMKFYTKVLSRFANGAGLKLHVHFEVPIKGETGKPRRRKRESP